MPRGRPKNYDEGEVLEAAVQVFWNHGFDEAALEEVIERSGISRQSLYKHFGSKSELFRIAIRHYAEASEAQWDELLASARSPLGSLRELLGRWTSCPTDLEGRGCLMVASVNALMGRDEVFASYAAEHMERQRAKLERTLAAAQAAGEIAPEVDAEALGAKLFAQILGMATMARMPGGRDIVGTAARAALAELDRVGIG